MKFGKEYSSQMVPEWQQAYMDYNFLKTLLKEIIRFKHRTNNAHPRGGAKNDGGFNRKMTLHRAFSGLISTPGRQRRVSSQDVEEGIQLTKAKSTTGPILVNASSSRGCETTFLMAAEEGGEYELVFFRRLDDEFNKVQRFYKEKVEEVIKEAVMLNKQMDALIAFRIKVENPDGWRWEERTVEITRLASDIATSAAALSASTPAGAKSIRNGDHMEAIQEGGSSRAGLMEDDEDEEDDNEISVVSTGEIDDVYTSRMRRARPAPIDVLDRVKINNTKETPRSTIRGVLKVSKQTELKFSRDNLMKVEERLRRAFIEFYQKLRLLKSYSILNVLAFSKILKNYDKAMRLMERVEATFIKHSAN